MTKLKLRTNNPWINQFKEQIVALSINMHEKTMTGTDGSPAFWNPHWAAGSTLLHKNDINISDIYMINIFDMTVCQYGWLEHTILFENYNDSEELEIILLSGKESIKEDRSLFIKLDESEKIDCDLIYIELHSEKYGKFYIVADMNGKIYPAKCGNMFTYEWDENSKKSLQSIQKNKMS